MLAAGHNHVYTDIQTELKWEYASLFITCVLYVYNVDVLDADFALSCSCGI